MFNTVTMVLLTLETYGEHTPSFVEVWDVFKQPEYMLTLAVSKGYDINYINEWTDYCVGLGFEAFKQEVQDMYTQLTGRIPNEEN